MENVEVPKKKSRWKVVLGIIGISILVLIVFSIMYSSLKSLVWQTAVPKSVRLDFQNPSGVGRIQSTFSEVLVGSVGSTKKGDGYVVNLTIVNPTSIDLRNVTCKFTPIGSTEPVTYSDVNVVVYPGSSITVKCFISGLSDSALKSIDVSVGFNQMSSR